MYGINNNNYVAGWHFAIPYVLKDMCRAVNRKAWDNTWINYYETKKQLHFLLDQDLFCSH